MRAAVVSVLCVGLAVFVALAPWGLDPVMSQIKQAVCVALVTCAVKFGLDALRCLIDDDEQESA